MTYSRRKLLIEEREPLGSDTPRPSNWWRYGAIAAGAGLAAARLGGIAFAAPHDAVHDTTPSWSYDPGHDAATWTLASQEYAPGYGDGDKDDKKRGDSAKHEKSGAKQAAKPHEPAKPQAVVQRHQDDDKQDDRKQEDRQQPARFQNNQGDQGNLAQNKQGENQQDRTPKHATPKSTKVPTAVATAVLGQQATPVDDDQDKLGICHQTGSSSNPRVFIEVSRHAATAHEGHGDRVGVSAEDCASAQVGAGTPTAVATSTAPAATSTPVPTGTAVSTPTGVPTGTVEATVTAQPTNTVQATATPTVNRNETVVVTETPVPTNTVQTTATVVATGTPQATATVGATGTPQATGTVQATQTTAVTGTPTAQVLGEQASRGLLEVLVANLSKLLAGLFGDR